MKPSRPTVLPAKLRQEIFSLGGRHGGDALAGALVELKAPGLTPERRSLLRAVVAHLQPGRRNPPGSGESSAAPPAWLNLPDAGYIAVIAAAAAWVAMILK